MHIFVSILSEEFKKNTIFSKKISLNGFPCNLNFFHFKPLIKIDIIQSQKKNFLEIVENLILKKMTYLKF